VHIVFDSLSYPMIMEFLSSSSILFLFSVCFNIFHRNISFNVLGSNSYIDGMPVAKLRFQLKNRASADRREWPTLLLLSSTGTGCSVSCTIFSSFLRSIYDWGILTLSLTDTCANTMGKREESVQTHLALEISHAFYIVSARPSIWPMWLIFQRMHVV